MRFPPNAYRKFLETADQRNDREKEEKEIAAEIEREEEDF
jgi:hypothetical protein